MEPAAHHKRSLLLRLLLLVCLLLLLGRLLLSRLLGRPLKRGSRLQLLLQLLLLVLLAWLHLRNLLPAWVLLYGTVRLVDRLLRRGKWGRCRQLWAGSKGRLLAPQPGK
jgi:hypothetical protein